MDLIGLTTTEAVRAVLGVSVDSNELPDQYFTDRKLDAALFLEFHNWLPDTIENLYAAAMAAGSTDADHLLWLAIEQAATYWGAWACADNNGLGYYQTIEDGQNKTQRPQVDFEKLAKRMWVGYQSYKAQALEISNALAAPASTSWLAGVSVPTFDPITGV
jgi:hypothetical protein